MAVTASEFWQQAVRIGIIDSATAKTLVQQFNSSVGDRPNDTSSAGKSDPAVAAQFLIANKVISRFQAQRLLAGRAGELRVGEYLILDRCETSPLSRWYRARHLGQPTECFLYPCTDALTSNRWVDPEWLKQHTVVSADGLQPVTIITMVASDPWRGAIVSDIPDGTPLDQWFTGQVRTDKPSGLDHSTVASIGKVISGSITKLHDAGLIHGEVRPSRVWYGSDQSLWLLRDAGRPPLHPDESAQEHRWLDDDSQTHAYRAPEQDLPGATPSALADLFSLGAMLYFLATGKTVRSEGEPFSLPREVSSARDAGALGDPLMRTLAFALDPNPAARFPNIHGFEKALEVVVSTYKSNAPAVAETPAKETNAAVAKPVKVVAAAVPVASQPRVAPTIAPVDAPRKAKVAKVVQVATAPPIAPLQKLEPVSPEIVAEPKPEQTSTGPQTSAKQSEPEADTASRKRVRKRTRRTRRGPIIVGTVAAVALLGILAVVLQPSTPEPITNTRPVLPPRPTVATRDSSPAQPEVTKVTSDSAESASGFEIVQDDRLLWASPWPPESEKPSLAMVPPGSQLIINLNPSQFVRQSAPAQWLDWLEPELRPALDQFEKRSGVSIGNVDRLTIAFSAGASGHPQAAFAVRLRESENLKSIGERWGVTPSRTRDGKTIYTDDTPDGDTYFIKENAGDVSSFVFGPVYLITLVAENDGNEIPLARSLAQLWNTASDQADVTVLAIPNFLFADGRELLGTYAPRAIEPLKSILIPDVAGVLVSMDVDRSWYMEARLSPSGNVSAPSMLQAIEPKVRTLPNWAEDFAIDGTIDASWRAMAIRLPQYMRAIADQTRFGVSQTLPMLNFHLPVEAAPQVSLATVLAMSAPATKSATVMEVKSSAPALTMERLLDVPFSVSFDQESLEFAIGMIRDEFNRSVPAGSNPPEITILGGDLEKSGITQNQQIRDFQMRSKPLREALNEIVRQANPDKTVTSLKDPKQALVWIVSPDSSPEAPKILITTRPAAEAKKWSLPDDFNVGSP